MSKPTFVRIIAAAIMIATAAMIAGWRHINAPPDWSAWPTNRDDLFARLVLVPAGDYTVGSREPGCFPPAVVSLNAFYIWPVEVTRTRAANTPDATPLASVTYDEARAICREISEAFGVTARLPTPDEWQVAARAGTPSVTYPWGWATPDGRAVFDAAGPAPVASLPANPWGLHDMAGNLAEWCLAEESATTAPVLGGSWAERSPAYLRISHHLELPKPYRDADVGFRFVVEHPTSSKGNH
jgi:hypothetical protein